MPFDLNLLITQNNVKIFINSNKIKVRHKNNAQINHELTLPYLILKN